MKYRYQRLLPLCAAALMMAGCAQYKACLLYTSDAADE